jgi:uncharacterized protein YjbI with pentapeptide repeats
MKLTTLFSLVILSVTNSFKTTCAEELPTITDTQPIKPLKFIDSQLKENIKKWITEKKHSNCTSKNANLYLKKKVKILNLETANISKTTLKGANLEGTDLIFTDSKEMILKIVNLQKSELVHTKIFNVGLQHTALKKVNTKGLLNNLENKK